MNKNLFLFFAGILLFSCVAITPTVDLATKSVVRVADPELSNATYANRLAKDGWPVHLLNSAADHDYMEDEEKNLILAHNIIRHNPGKFAELYVTEYIHYYHDKVIHFPGLELTFSTEEGKKPAIELYWQLMNTEPMNPLIPARGLHLAALFYADYLAANQASGHDWLGGIARRIEKYGVWEQLIGENISYGSISPHDALMVLLINDDVPERSHRANILNPEYRYIGVGMDYHPLFAFGETYVIKYAFRFTDHPERFWE